MYVCYVCYVQIYCILLKVTLSYGQFQVGPPGAKKEIIQNVINTHKIIPTFSPEIDPTR